MSHAENEAKAVFLAAISADAASALSGSGTGTDAGGESAAKEEG
jgi:hypothetical protein